MLAVVIATLLDTAADAVTIATSLNGKISGLLEADVTATPSPAPELQLAALPPTIKAVIAAPFVASIPLQQQSTCGLINK